VILSVLSSLALVSGFFFILFLMRSCTTTLKPHKPGLGLPPSLEEPYEAEAPRTVLKPSLSSNGA
jgi:hypothetical protein